MAMGTILLVENNQPSRDALATRLERRGYEVVVATEGLEAEAAGRLIKPDLILMDLGPGIDGWESTRRLKGHHTTRAIPIIVLSAHARAADRDRALAAGGDDFDTKPIRFEPLLEKIAALLAKRELVQ